MANIFKPININEVSIADRVELRIVAAMNERYRPTASIAARAPARDSGIMQ